MINIFLYREIKNVFPQTENAKIKALEKIGIKTISDILYYFPKRYESSSSAKLIEDLVSDEFVTIYGKIENLETGKSFKSKIPKAEGVVTDSTGKVKVTWLHQPYIAKIIKEGSLVKVHGKVTKKGNSASMLNPEIEMIDRIPDNIGENLFSIDYNTNENISSDQKDTSSMQNGLMTPVYPETKGITSKWLYHKIQKIFSHKEFENIIDSIPQEILDRYNLPNIRTALIWMHTPKRDGDAQVARKRFAFEEIFLIQIKNEQTRALHSKEQAFVIKKEGTDGGQKSVKDFTSRFPFPLTESQDNAIKDILEDFTKGHPMSRLLEGDVGSGKTAVAASTAYAVVTSRPKGQDFGTLQVAYMAPTEILAKQHFESFIQYFHHLPISVALITGSGCKKFPSKLNPSGWTDISRSQLIKWVKNGEIAVVIGTHALIQKSVEFKHLAYVIIDEQHRFGTAQRQKLMRKQKIVPHLLSMTATPIPRTLALTLYGDLDLTLLDQMPSGRKKPITEIVLPSGREKVYQKIHAELEAGRQIYVICPRIDEPDPDKQEAMIMKSVKAEAERLKKDVFKKYRIDIMHSKMKPAEKEEVMDRFSRHEIDILVSTSVVEVGVNVPNASVIVIEGGERFGLSQLHQLRGRVIRGNHQPYCFVFTTDGSRSTDKTVDRLKALATAKNGFELSELDMAQRGTGDLYGNKQWGISDLAMDAIKNIKMVEMARKEAKEIVGKYSTNEELGREFPALALRVESKREVHME